MVDFRSATGWLFAVAATVFWGAVIVFFLYAPDPLSRMWGGKSINVLAWPGVLDASYLEGFERETGIRVRITYFEHNEELFVKLRSSGGADYDLIMPSSYAAELLIKEGLLKKIEKKKLSFWDRIHSSLLGHYYDKRNEYTTPYVWGVYGLAIDKRYFGDQLPDPSWRLVFDKRYVPGCVGMIDDAREAPLIAALYLFGEIDGLDSSRLEQVKTLLLNQKKWVVAYVDLRPDHILQSGAAPVVVTNSLEIFKLMWQFEHVDFLIPREGSFIEIDSFAMPVGTDKEDFVYQFLNYLYRPNILESYAQKFAFLSPTADVTIAHPRFPFSKPTPELFSQLHFFRNVVPLSQLTALWIALKS